MERRLFRACARLCLYTRVSVHTWLCQWDRVRWTVDVGWQAALKLLQAEMPIQIRLMGLRMANFLEVKVHPKQQTLSVFVKRRCSSTSGASSQGPSEASLKQEPSTSQDLQRIPIPLSMQRHPAANAEDVSPSVSLSGRVCMAAGGGDCGPTSSAGANALKACGDPAIAPTSRDIPGYNGPDADPVCTCEYSLSNRPF